MIIKLLSRVCEISNKKNRGLIKSYFALFYCIIDFGELFMLLNAVECCVYMYWYLLPADQGHKIVSNIAVSFFITMSRQLQIKDLNSHFKAGVWERLQSWMGKNDFQLFPCNAIRLCFSFNFVEVGGVAALSVPTVPEPLFKTI